MAVTSSFPVFGRLTALVIGPIDAQCHPTLPGAENGDPGEHDDRHGPDHQFNVSALFQDFDCLHAGLRTADRPNYHDGSQAVKR